jgi:hypothetical protein
MHLILHLLQVVLGLGPGVGYFVWDNELGMTEKMAVTDLQVACMPVTVAQFSEFVIRYKVLYQLRKEGWGGAIARQHCITEDRQPLIYVWSVL